MNVKEILKKHLKDNGFDGLYCEDCGCDMNDFLPGDMCPLPECEPGYKVECDCGDHDWHIHHDNPKNKEWEL